MKKVFLAILVLISFSASAQWTIINGNQRFAKGLGIPTHDTIFSSNPGDTSQIVLRPQDTSIYVKYKGKWKKVGASSGGAGTQDLQSVLNIGQEATFKDIILHSDDTTYKGVYLYHDLGYFSNGVELDIFGKYNNTGLSFQVNDEPTNSMRPRINFMNNADNNPTVLTVPPVNNSDTICLPPFSVNSSGNDTLATLADVRNGGSTIDTTSLSNRIEARIKYTDSATMLSPYLRKIDTTNKFVNTITRIAGKDSIIFYVGSTRYAIKDSVGGNGYVPYTGATLDVDLGTHNLSAQSLQAMGTGGNGHILLKHQSADATATGSSTSLFANSAGDLKYKNDGNYYTTLKTSSNTADRVYTFQNKTYTLGDSADIATRVKYTDTANMLTPYLRKVDTATLSTRIDTKQDKSLTSYSFMANKTNATANATAQTFKDTTGTYTGTIAWTGTTAPTTANASFRLTQIGNLVTLTINVVYTTAGSALTQAVIPFISSFPTPAEPSGFGAASEFLYQGTGGLLAGLSTMPASYPRTFIRANAADNGYDVIVGASAGVNAKAIILTVQYFTN